ncbi:hypothetical protein YC2023_081403 [Brassica napus]
MQSTSGSMVSEFMLDPEQYGHWKVKMKASLQSVDMDVWASVEDGYEVPKAVDKDGVVVNKPLAKWTKREKEMSKYNAKALCGIFTSVKKKQLDLIQGCKNAKEAWDILQLHFEGTEKVKSSRMDFFKSKFENLKMEEHESVSDFSSQLSALAQEARVLGMDYKDKKLVKKILRCLPEKFTAYKAAMFVSLDIDKFSFHEVVGMLKAHEMELDGVGNHSEVNLAVAETTSQKSEDEEEMVKMICMLHQVLREVIQWQGHEEVAVRKQRQEDGEPCSNKDVQCYKCRGFGHFKRECPMAKRRRFKGFRWRKIGHGEIQKKERSFIREDDNESEKDEVFNLVAFGAHKDEASTSSESDSESEEGKYDEGLDDGLRECYKQVCGTLVKLGKENMVLVKEQRRLEALIEVLQKDLQVEKEETRQARVKPGETQKRKIETVSMSAMKPVVKKYARTTSYGKTAVKTATATRTASSSAKRKISEVKSVSQRPFIPVCHHCEVVGHIRPKFLRLLREKQHIERVYDMMIHGPTCYSCGVQGHIRRDCFKLVDQRGTSKSGAKEACQVVRRDVRQGV